MKARLTRPRIIIGGGPVGSNLARIISESGKPVTLINNPLDLGSHNDISRLVRLSLDGNEMELAQSQKAILVLLTLHKRSLNPIITSKPGMLFIASPNTVLAQQLSFRAQKETSLLEMTTETLAKQFPFYPMHCPKGTKFWYHPEGYVINPQQLSLTNREIAVANNCEMIIGNAGFQLTNNTYHVDTNSGDLFATDELYLLTGARNKEIASQSGLKIPGFESTYLSAISTIRYKITTEHPTGQYMPIVLGDLQFPDFNRTVDFSTMPESPTVIKTRLSGPALTERVETADEKNNLEVKAAQKESLELFNTIFPFLTNPYDFKRCVTYRNKNKLVNGLSFFAIQSMSTGVRPLRASTQKTQLITTLGCYGVHARFGTTLAEGIKWYALDHHDSAGFHMDTARLASTDYLTESLIEHKEFLEKSGLSKRIGRTPVKKISPNIFMKLEGSNLTGSIKDRPALYVLLKKINSGDIRNGDTVVTASSGSYGVSLFQLKILIEKYLAIKFALIVVTPFAYRDKPGVMAMRQPNVQEVMEQDLPTIHAFSGNVLLYAKSDFTSAIALAASLATKSRHVLISQQYDELHVMSHQSTARELAEQLPEVTDLIVTAGTGATAVGMHRFFERPIRIHCRPTTSGTIAGLTDPTRYQNFFNPNHFVGYQKGLLDPEKAMEHKNALKELYDLHVGHSTGAAVSIAAEVQKQRQDAVIAIISPSF